MKNTSFWRLEKRSSNKTDHGTSCPSSAKTHFPTSKSDNYKAMVSMNNSSDVYNYKTLAYSGGTLPRNRRKGGSQMWNSMTRSPEQHRKVIVLEKEDEEAFGFEIQTYGLHQADETSVEMCTFICKVCAGSPAHRAGLRVGDTISGVNEASVDGFRHKEIVQLIRSSGNTIRLETVYSDSLRKAELETRLQYLRQTLQEKWDEYESLMKQEQKLLHGILMSDEAISESKALACFNVGNPSPVPSPAPHQAHHPAHVPSGSSRSASNISAATADSAHNHANPSPSNRTNGRSTEERPPGGTHRASGLFATAKTNLTRSASTRSYLRGAAGHGGSEKQGGASQGLYGSLPRRAKQNSLCRHLLRFIPGLNRPLEEDENKL
ncbi:general receptor for phosphoinositides 1-associated scaffold protein-like isoform X1 [Conger conger]|uniref:general receptor for phosphoinositides 1-associated scaffold protein-like isoform X1 n=2 Tax=Conger conger TaxID=82655 RepID=UPI002A5AC755|nr:general receptor for phosphoinositides 1-associated scaffold protein-like isoform X1 [Conger conger]